MEDILLNGINIWWKALDMKSYDTEGNKEDEAIEVGVSRVQYVIELEQFVSQWNNSNVFDRLNELHMLIDGQML
jgi:hypothetical protein